MKLKIKHTENLTTIIIKGSIKSGHEFDLEKKLKIAVDKKNNIDVDMSAVLFANSALIAMFIDVQNCIDKTNNRMRILYPPDTFLILIRMARLETKLKICGIRRKKHA